MTQKTPISSVYSTPKLNPKISILLVIIIYINNKKILMKIPNKFHILYQCIIYNNHMFYIIIKDPINVILKASKLHTNY